MERSGGVRVQVQLREEVVAFLDCIEGLGSAPAARRGARDVECELTALPGRERRRELITVVQERR